MLVGDEAIRVLQDVASHLEALASRLHDLVHGLPLGGGRDGRQQPSPLHVWEGQLDLSLQGLQAHVVFLERQELLRIEAGRGLVDALQCGALDHVLLTEELCPVIQ